MSDRDHSEEFERPIPGEVCQIDRDMGHPFPCSWCGFAWSVHRCGDLLCPATYEHGGLWQGAWEKDGAPGTTFKPDVVRSETDA